MSKYWLQYEKGEAAKYISHLDFVRTMNRTLRRGGVPIAYSQGFNPHPQLSFALALSVGVTSISELMTVELAEDLEPHILIEKLNLAAPQGLKFTAAGITTEKNMFKNITWAAYIVKPSCLPTQEQIDIFLALDEIIVAKKTKSGTKETDIKEDVFIIKLIDNYIEMTLSAGSVSNLKPDTVIEAFNRHIDGYNAGSTAYCRIKMYNDKFEVLV